MTRRRGTSGVCSPRCPPPSRPAAQLRLGGDPLWLRRDGRPGSWRRGRPRSRCRSSAGSPCVARFRRCIAVAPGLPRPAAGERTRGAEDLTRSGTCGPGGPGGPAGAGSQWSRCRRGREAGRSGRDGAGPVGRSSVGQDCSGTRVPAGPVRGRWPGARDRQAVVRRLRVARGDAGGVECPSAPEEKVGWPRRQPVAARHPSWSPMTTPVSGPKPTCRRTLRAPLVPAVPCAGRRHGVMTASSTPPSCGSTHPTYIHPTPHADSTIRHPALSAERRRPVHRCRSRIRLGRGSSGGRPWL